jgi:hypothetical protein
MRVVYRRGVLAGVFSYDVKCCQGRSGAGAGILIKVPRPKYFLKKFSKLLSGKKTVQDFSIVKNFPKISAGNVPEVL